MDGRRLQPGEVSVLLVASLLVTAAAILGGRFDLMTGPRPVVLYETGHTYALPATTERQRYEGAWQASPNGLTLAPTSSGSLAFMAEPAREGRLSLFVEGFSGNGFRTTVAISRDGRQFRDVLRSVSVGGARIDLTSHAGHVTPLWVKVSTFGLSGHVDDKPFVLSRVRLVEVRPPIAVPDIALSAILVLAPLLAAMTRRGSGMPGALPFGLAVLAGLSILAEAIVWTRDTDPMRWWEIVVATQSRDMYFLLPYGMLVLLYGLYGSQERAATWIGSERRIWSRFAVTGILIWAASRRLGAFLEVAWSPLNPDAITYMKLAELMNSPYDTGLREPLWIWLVYGWFQVVGASPITLRLLTFCLSLGVVWAAYQFAKEYTGQPVIGLLTAALLAANPFLTSLSARGLREEAYILAVLGLVAVVLVPHRRLSARGEAVVLALAGAAAQLLRFNSYTFLVPLLAWWLWRKPKERLVLAAIPLLFITAVSIPHLQHNAKHFGDPLFSVNAHFMWIRNYEFVVLKGEGCQGCPSREEFEINSVSGPNIGAFEYVFGMHTVGEAMRMMLEGYVQSYFWPSVQFEIQTGTRSFWLFAVYVLGLGLVLIGPYRECLVVILLLANGVPLVLSMGIDARLGDPTIPFVTFILAYGLWWMGTQTVRLLRSIQVGTIARREGRWAAE